MLNKYIILIFNNKAVARNICSVRLMNVNSMLLTAISSRYTTFRRNYNISVVRFSCFVSFEPNIIFFFAPYIQALQFFCVLMFLHYIGDFLVNLFFRVNVEPTAVCGFTILLLIVVIWFCMVFNNFSIYSSFAMIICLMWSIHRMDKLLLFVFIRYIIICFIIIPNVKFTFIFNF